MDDKNVVFEVTKVGFAVNTKWSVFVDNEYIGKIDFKNSLTKKLPKGVHSVQYKIGAQKTKVLDINVADEDIIVECVWDGTVRNFHVIGNEDTITNKNEITNNSNNEDIIFCNKCGTKISSKSLFCYKCGNKIEQVNTKNFKLQNDISENNVKVNTENIKAPIKNNKIIGLVVVIVLFIGVIFFSLSRNSVNDRTTDLDGTYTRKTYLNSYTLVIKDGKATFSEDGVGKIQTYDVKKGSVEYHFYLGNEKALFGNYNETTKTLNIRGIVKDKNGKGVTGESGNLDGTGGSNWIKQ